MNVATRCWLTIAILALAGVGAPLLAQRAAWTLTLTETPNPLPIGNCGSVYLAITDPAQRAPVRNPIGQYVSIADFDMTATAPDPTAVVGSWSTPTAFSVCACQTAAVGMPITITATYPAAQLATSRQVPGVTAQSSVTIPVRSGFGTANPPGCPSAVGTVASNQATTTSSMGMSARSSPMSATSPTVRTPTSTPAQAPAPTVPSTGTPVPPPVASLKPPADDYPQYLLATGVRASSGFAVTGTMGAGTIPATGAGNRLMWYPGKAAFRAGRAQSAEWDDVNIGPMSMAFGLGTTASGGSATALGQYSVASGQNSTAMGFNAIASGQSSIAIGQDLSASGQNSTALGRENTATGKNSTAMGYRSHATGDFSFALGSFARTNGQEGSFVYADNASAYAVSSSAPNQFLVRASGGFRFRTATDLNLSTGCDLPAGSGSWSCTSSRLAKTNFMRLNGDAVLAKIARMPIQSWTYRADPTSARHAGPTAQDFRAAFGLGNDDTSISLVDIDGINLLAVQALVRRTHALERENAALRARLKDRDAEIRARLERLEAAITRECDACRR